MRPYLVGANAVEGVREGGFSSVSTDSYDVQSSTDNFPVTWETVTDAAVELESKFEKSFHS
jgi:hypothetical protein